MAEIFSRLVDVLDQHVDLPAQRLMAVEVKADPDIELRAEQLRDALQVGCGPLLDVVQIAESAGVVVVRSDALGFKIDAVSFQARRPLIMLGLAGRSSCAERFAIAREMAQFALCSPQPDWLPRSELAVRFATALLLPRDKFGKECRSVVRGGRLSWGGLSELKLRWRVSKAMMLNRCYRLGYLETAQLMTGLKTLKRHGEAINEREDDLIPCEEPRMIQNALEAIRQQLAMHPAAVARLVGIQPRLLNEMLKISEAPSSGLKVIPFSASPRRALPVGGDF